MVPLLSVEGLARVVRSIATRDKFCVTQNRLQYDVPTPPSQAHHVALRLSIFARILKTIRKTADDGTARRGAYLKVAYRRSGALSPENGEIATRARPVRCWASDRPPRPETETEDRRLRAVSAQTASRRCAVDATRAHCDPIGRL
ncbi:unnamed protein product, partial [Iphiclides podalirius]